MRRTRTRTAIAAVAAAAALVLSACGSSEGGSTDAGDQPTSSQEQTSEGTDAGEETTDSDAGGTETSDSETDEATGAIDGTGKTLTIPIASGWDEDVVVTALWKHALEQKGYTVDTPTLDIGPIFKGVATGDYDFFFDTWLPNTHADYWDEFGKDVDDLGVWYENAPLTIAVPDYMDIDSMEDLKSIGDEVDKTITGIDPGAGLSRVTEEDMMPAYGLDDWTLKLSSTSAMLAALKNATDNKEPIVVTLWKPHWAYGAFPIKDLEDPQGAMGAPDQIHVIGSTDFSADNADIVKALGDFTISDDQLASLEVTVLQDHEDDPDAGLAAWIADNQDYVDSLLG